MSELLESRWQETKGALLEGLTGNKKSVMASTLENTRKYLSESATAGATSAGNVATLNRVILPVIRRVMPTVIANELVGVQPMTGPVGQIHTLRVRYADTFNAGASGATAGEEALSPFKIAESYSGATSGKAAATAAQEGTAGNRLSIQILKQTVEAKTRKNTLGAKYFHNNPDHLVRPMHPAILVGSGQLSQYKTCIFGDLKKPRKLCSCPYFKYNLWRQDHINQALIICGL